MGSKEAKELYDIAYRLHYLRSDYEKALPLYESVIKQYPDSKEAEDSRCEIKKLNKLLKRDIDSLIDRESTNTTQIKREEEGGFFSFRTMITPVIIKILYVLGAIALIIVGIVMISDNLNSRYGSDEEVWIGFGLIILGNLIWRIICEGIILMFNIHERLTSIDKKTH